MTMAGGGAPLAVAPSPSHLLSRPQGHNAFETLKNRVDSPS